MKKRICSIVLAVLMLVCFTIPAFAADVSNTTIIDCGDGYYLKVTLTEYVPEAATRAIYQKTATSKADAYHGNTYIGTFYLNGTFQYDTVTSKATADSWSASSSYGYSGDSSRSGNKVSGYCTFNYAGGKKLTMSITCGKNGKISYD